MHAEKAEQAERSAKPDERENNQPVWEREKEKRERGRGWEKRNGEKGRNGNAKAKPVRPKLQVSGPVGRWASGSTRGLTLALTLILTLTHLN